MREIKKAKDQNGNTIKIGDVVSITGKLWKNDFQNGASIFQVVSFEQSRRKIYVNLKNDVYTAYATTKDIVSEM